MIPDTEISKIKQILNNNGVIAFPTDTVWGVGCLVKNPEAVEKIYRMKGRDRGKPLILLGNSLDTLLPYVKTMPDKAKELAEKHLPGALTLVMEKSDRTPDYVTSGFDTVGIRIPDHPVFLEMLEKTSGVLATTSANVSGEGAFSCREDVENSIEVDYILDDYGFSAGGRESTVVKVDRDNKIKVFRQGAIKL